MLVAAIVDLLLQSPIAGSEISEGWVILTTPEGSLEPVHGEYDSLVRLFKCEGWMVSDTIDSGATLIKHTYTAIRHTIYLEFIRRIVA